MLEMCQDLMKLVECMEDNDPQCHQRELISKVTQKAGPNKWKWEKLTNEKKECVRKKPMEKKEKGDLLKVKCFNYEQYGHQAKDCPRSPQVSKISTQCKEILQSGFNTKKTRFF
jgi:hypothetical protein